MSPGRTGQVMARGRLGKLWGRCRLRCTVLLAVALVVQLVVLKELRYSRAQFELLSDESPPAPNFRMGSVEWDISHYSTEPALEPLRDYYRSVAGGRTGLAAAVAISRDIAGRCPFGDQPRDF